MSPSSSSRFALTRRRFAFWLGLGIFNVAEVLRADGLDDVAAAVMRAADPSKPKKSPTSPEHWTPAENNAWRWFERETMVDGKWKVTGITTPVHKRTGERHAGTTGYLDDALVPDEMRNGEFPVKQASAVDTEIEDDPGQASSSRRARHGRPPSRWLRSLHADELRIWLKTIEVPEVGVIGMTYWQHLTRDHSFNPDHIKGLQEPEQAKLHAAAHYGY